MTIGWIFDRGLDSGKTTGNSAPQQVFRSQKVVGVFEREALQNCGDQKTGSTVTIDIQVRDLSDSAKSEFLEALNWDQLSEHLKACSSDTSPYALGIKENLYRINNKNEPLRICLINDYGTKGLIGGEDDHKKEFRSFM